MANDADSLGNLAVSVLRKQGGTPEREQLLADLAERIRTGQYHVDDEQLAEALLKDLRRSEPKG